MLQPGDDLVKSALNLGVVALPCVVQGVGDGLQLAAKLCRPLLKEILQLAGLAVECGGQRIKGVLHGILKRGLPPLELRLQGIRRVAHGILDCVRGGSKAGLQIIFSGLDRRRDVRRGLIEAAEQGVRPVVYVVPHFSCHVLKGCAHLGGALVKGLRQDAGLVRKGGVHDADALRDGIVQVVRLVLKILHELAGLVLHIGREAADFLVELVGKFLVLLGKGGIECLGALDDVLLRGLNFA